MIHLLLIEMTTCVFKYKPTWSFYHTVMPCPISSSEGTTDMVETTPHGTAISTHALSSELTQATAQTLPIDNDISSTEVTYMATEPMVSITEDPVSYHRVFSDITSFATQEPSNYAGTPASEGTSEVPLATSTTDSTSAAGDKLSTGYTAFISVSEAGDAYNSSVTSFVQCIVSLIETNAWNGPCSSHFATAEESSITRETETMTVRLHATSSDAGYTVKHGIISAKNSKPTDPITEKSNSPTTTQSGRPVTGSSEASSIQADHYSYIGIIKFVPKSHEATGASIVGTLVICIVGVVVGCIVYSDLPMLRKHFGIILVNLRIIKLPVHRVP